MTQTKCFKTFLKAIELAGCALLTIFAGLFGLLAICALVCSIIDGCLISAVASVASAFLSALCWSLRKTPLQ